MTHEIATASPLSRKRLCKRLAFTVVLPLALAFGRCRSFDALACTHQLCMLLSVRRERFISSLTPVFPLVLSCAAAANNVSL